MSEIVKDVLIPGSVFFLLLGLLSGLLLLHLGPRPALWGRRWLVALSALYFLLSLPIVSSALIDTLRVADRDHAPERAIGDNPAVLVVIGAGVVSYSANGRSIHEMGRRTAYRVLEASRIYQLTEPAWVIASGGIADPASQIVPESAVIRDQLITLGVPADRILLESQSQNTAEQIANVARILRERQLPNRIVVVTTPADSRRVMLLAREQHLAAVPALTKELAYGSDDGWQGWRPSVDALRGSESATYEYLAFTREIVASLW
jgi:uncharacterized SAM-binding protein YcdF (DUF218 family)